MHGPTHMSAHSQTQDKVKCTFSRVLIKLRDCTLQQSTYRCLVRKDTHIVDSISSQMSSNCCWCQKIIQTIWHISTAECQLEKPVIVHFTDRSLLEITCHTQVTKLKEDTLKPSRYKNTYSDIDSSSHGRVKFGMCCKSHTWESH